MGLVRWDRLRLQSLHPLLPLDLLDPEDLRDLSDLVPLYYLPQLDLEHLLDPAVLSVPVGRLNLPQ